MKTKIDWREWRPVLIASCGIMLLTLLPYLPGFLLAQPPYRFAGMIYNIEDYRTYLAKMWLGYRGDWLYTSTFTAQEHPAAFVYPFYILLGHVARWTGLTVPLMYQLARLVSGVLFLLMVYRFAAAFLPRPARWYAFLLTAVGSGLSWLALFLPMTSWYESGRPSDMWIPEGHVFFSLTVFPHFIVAYLCIIGFFLNILPIVENDTTQPLRRYVFGAMLFGVALGLIHPYMVLPLGLISGFYLLWRTLRARQFVWRSWLLLVGIGLVIVPVAGYSLAVFALIPHYREWLAQGVMPSPGLPSFFFGYGLLWLLAAWGVWQLRAHPRLPFLLIWLAVTFVLLYIPHNVQRRFIEGAPLPLGVLAGAGLIYGLVPWISRRFAALKQRYPQRVAGWRWLTLTYLMLFLSLGNVFVFASLALATTVRDSFYYYRDDDAAAMAWLLAQNTWDEPVLSAPETGNLLGGQIGQKVVIGHWAETFAYEELVVQVEQFFNAEWDERQRQQWLAEWGAGYVYYGPAERGLGSFDPAQADYLELVFSEGEVMVYRVVQYTR